MYYSVEEFANKAVERVGNVKFFRECLRRYNILGDREQLSESHIPIFNEIRTTRNSMRINWNDAMEKVLQKYAQNDQKRLEQLLEQILQTQREILAAIKQTQTTNTIGDKVI
ncbi:hypothetical protein HGO21_03545 [Acinetobacter sp. CUI P1]|nr:hypothetical protein [Acinetobacter sp. CUI P1]